MDQEREVDDFYSIITQGHSEAELCVKIKENSLIC